ncbi:hypothetical protein SDC9_118284 [bioreactor metagenome]|uniref:Uncharacterized protein n=1 Tax=bioreactor metagenome TaxID=1076179 RepID=A0A645C0M7_9ZZZZ
MVTEHGAHPVIGQAEGAVLSLEAKISKYCIFE